MKRFGLLVSGLLLIPWSSTAVAQEGDFTPASLASETIPLTTSSDEARSHFLAGQYALDMGRPDDARGHLEQAVAADPDFALAHLNLAFASTSLEEYKRHLETASEKAADASEAERLMIEAEVQSFQGDEMAALETARRLTEVQPSSPRARMVLASAQSDVGREEEARVSLREAAEIGSTFAPAHMVLANSYLLAEPRDLAQAQTHAEKAVELAPEEAVPHDLLGDAYRAQGQLETAAEQYTRVAELDPDNGIGYQQRGHVRSFLGRYDEARSDYDRAIELEEGKNQAAAFGVYRSLVSVHEGNAQAAIDELNELVNEIDGMGIPGARGQKIFGLNTIITIALHHDMFDVARRAIERRNRLLQEQAELAGTEEARRGVRATAAITDGFLAAREGELDLAVQKADEARSILEPSADPEKNQPIHALLGFVSLERENYDEAVGHFEQADEDNIYVNYYHAKALEGAGETAEATRLYEKVATWNFNSPGLALVREDAAIKARS